MRDRTPIGRRRALALLLLILLAGGVLRVRFALESPSSGRFFDEGFALQNPAKILDERTLRPAKSYYPSPVFNLPPTLLLGLSEQLYERTGDPLFAIRGEGGWAPMAYYLTRLLQTLYGLIGIWLTYRIGSRMFSRRAGLVAALALAAAPWHLHASAYFKPDALLTTCVLLAFLLSLRAAARPTAGRHIAAGGGIALAMSAKMTGGLISLPLALASVLGAPRRRRLALLGLAAVASAGAFILLNPYWRAYLFWLDSLRDDYAMRAAWGEMSRLQIPRRTLELLTGPNVLGSALGWAGLAGALALAVGAARRHLPPGRRVERVMLLAFPLAYVVVYAVQTPYFKPNNFLPVVPFLCLALAWGIDCAWRWAAARARWLESRWGAAALAVVVVLLLLPRGVLYVYRSLVPTTTDLALYFLGAEQGGPAGRVVLVERHARRHPPFERAPPFSAGQSAVVEVERLDRVPAERLALADGEIFPRRRLTGATAEFYGSRIDAAPEATVAELAPRLFELRGPPLVAIRRPRLPRGGPLRVPMSSCGVERGCFAGRLPADLSPRAVVSLSFWLPYRVTGVEPREHAVEIGERTLPLRPASRSARSALFVTERFRLGEPGAVLRFFAGRDVDESARIGVTLHRWRKAVETGGKWDSG